MPSTRPAPRHGLRCAFLLSSALALGAALSACGGDDAPTPVQPIGDAQEEASITVGDTTVRANVLNTATLNEQVAQSYGITRDENRLLVLVATRRGPEGADSSPPTTVAATVSRLAGTPEPLALREQRVGDLVDHVATIDIRPPETLTFDIVVTPEGGSAINLRFVREFTPPR